MTGNTLRGALTDDETALVSWETWDRVKHTEGFILLAAIIFVGLFSWLFARAPITSELGGYHSLARSIIVLTIFALGFNLLLGQTGLLSFGHAMFLGTGAYAVALFAIYVYSDPLVLVIVGTLFAVLLAFATAFIVLRMHTVYFAIMTLAIAQMLFFIAREPAEAILGGYGGVRFIPEPLFGVIELRDPLPGIFGTLWGDYLYVFIAVFFILVVVLIARIRKSPYGLIFKGIRENETRLQFVGLNVWRYKFAAYSISGGIVGLSGSLVAMESLFAGIDNLHWMTSGEVVVMTLLGGLGTIAGPILGALIFAYFEGVVDGVAIIGRYWLLMLAVAFTAVVWKYPDGIWGFFKLIGQKIRSLTGDQQ